MALLGFGEGVLVKTYAGSGSQFSGDVVGIQNHFVVTDLDGFLIVRKFGAVLIGAQMAFEAASSRQYGNAG